MKAIVTMDVFMYTIRMLEESVHQCRKATEENTDSKKALSDLDGAVAFYTGSLEDGSGAGKFLYALADEECKQFKTCGPNGDALQGTAKVNLEIFEYLNAMQANTTTLSCSDARKYKDQILWKMRVPLIQGTLRYAYMRKHKQVTGTDKAVGAAYAASIVPLVAACNFQDAVIIGDSMETMTRETEFTRVKLAFEKNYACLAVTCSDIGGYYAPDKNVYHAGAEPCVFDTQVQAGSEDKKKSGWAIALPLFVVIAVGCFVQRRRNKKRKAKADRANDDEFSDCSSSSDDSDYDFRFS